jgi:hypothetical protein
MRSSNNYANQGNSNYERINGDVVQSFPPGCQMGQPQMAACGRSSFLVGFADFRPGSSAAGFRVLRSNQTDLK